MLTADKRLIGSTPICRLANYGIERGLIMYRLRKYKGGHYVARDGSVTSYTNKKEYARQFLTQEDAEKNRCVESEYIESDIK